jgi:hypothetical protein
MLTRENARDELSGRGVRGGRRVARADRQQARRAGAARAGALAAFPSRPRHLGTERDARQPGGCDARAVRAGPRAAAEAGAGPHRQDAADRHAASRRTRASTPGPGTLGAACSSRWWRRSRARAPRWCFTNVRSQAEIWYQLLLEARPDWAGHIALHHGRWTRATREWVEQGLKEARCAPWSRPPRWTWASTSCR